MSLAEALSEPVALDGPPPPASPVRSMYVHAPFCAQRCPYCDFAVTVSRGGDAQAWLAALAAEWDAVRREGLFAIDETLDTLYVGGGTPSLLGPEAMSGLKDVLGPARLAAPDLEWTAEANPESFTPEIAERWSEAGVNRVSLGVQTFHEPALAWMGRLHGPAGAYEAVRTARAAGLENFSVDLMFGLPERLERSWSDDLDSVLEMQPPHVSLYELSIEAGTPLGRAVAEGREATAAEESYADEYLEAARRLSEAGYEHYEVSNFARPGYQARHNSVYWTGLPYLGLGNGAHSYAHPIRRWNLRDWADYRGAAREGRLPVEGEETLDGASLRLERIWLALRTRAGLRAASLTTEGRAALEEWVLADLAQREAGIFRLTPRGWLSTDRLTLDLDARL